MLAFVASRAPTPRAAALAGLAWGAAASFPLLAPIPFVIQRFTPLTFGVGCVAWALLAIEHGAAYALAAWIAKKLELGLGAPRPLALAAGVAIGLHVPTLLPWTPAGLVATHLAMVQTAEWIGERGVDVLFVLAASLAVVALETRRARPALGAAALLAALFAQGTLALRRFPNEDPATPRLRVGLVQPSTGSLERWQTAVWPGIMIVLRELSRRAESAGAELVVWPEAAYPYQLVHAEGPTPHDERAIVGGVHGGRAGPHGPILTGLLTTASANDRYNSATVVAADGTMQLPADKLALLWFGETVPFGEHVAWLRETFQRGSGMVPGEAPRLLDAGRARMGVLNCYEDMLPDVARRVGGLAPNLFVNVSNDSWFDGSFGPALHARLAAMRAIEHRRDLVRAVNLGVSSWVDAAGRVRASSAESEPSVLDAHPALREGRTTLYARLGDTPTLGALAAALALFAFARRAQKTNAAR